MPGSRNLEISMLELLERFLREISLERGRSENTVAAYRSDITRYVTWLEEHGLSSLSQVTSRDLNEYVRQLQGAPRSVSRRLSAVRSFHRWLAAEEHLDADVSAEVAGPTLPDRLPKALRVDQVSDLLESISADDPVSLRDRALLETLYATGARVSEVVNLAVDDVVDFSGGTPDALRVMGKGRKERIVPLGSHARAALDAYLVRGRPALAEKARSSHPALFLGVRGAPLTRQNVWLILRGRAEAAGITEPLSPHTLRHSCATHLLAGGADVRVVQELLGHQSVTTTQIYTKVTIDSLRDVFYTAHPRAR